MKQIFFIVIINIIFLNNIFSQKHSFPFSQAKNYYIIADGYITLKDSLKDGLWIIYYDNDTTKKVFEGCILNSKRQGFWRNWYSNGVCQIERYYENGMINGVIRNWDLNGCLIQESYYVDNIPLGYDREWYPNKFIKNEEYYEYGKNKGLKKTFFDNGNIKSVENYGSYNSISFDSIFVPCQESTECCYDSILKTDCCSSTKGESEFTTYEWYSNGNKKRNIIQINNEELKIIEYFSEKDKIKKAGFVKYGSIIILKSASNDYCTCKYVKYTGYYKNGEWLLYDSNGKIIKKEFYINGVLQ